MKEAVRTSLRRSKASYKNDTEYKLIKNIFERVNIFLKSISKVKIAAVAVICAVIVMFACGLLKIGQAVYLNGVRVGTVSEHEAVKNALAAAEKAGAESKMTDFKFYPVFVWKSAFTKHKGLVYNIALADGAVCRGVRCDFCENAGVCFSDYQQFLCAAYNYISRYTNENTVSAGFESKKIPICGFVKSCNAGGAADGEEKMQSSLVPVITADRIVTREVIMPPLEQSYDSTSPKGEVTVIAEGAQGEKEVTKIISKRNGEISGEYTEKENVLCEPLARVEKIGTMIPSGSGSGEFARPVSGSITSGFGSRWGRMHDGIDYAGSVGDGVAAADGGTVKYCGEMSGYGNIIILDHKNGYETYYGHLSAILVKNGEKVKKGDIIGKVGNTGNSTGPHLHFEIRYNGVPKNPSGFVN